MRPTDVTLELKLKLPLVWLALLLLAVLLLPDRVWTTLLIGFGGLFVVAYAWARDMKNGLTARRRLRFGWVSVGDRMIEEFTIVKEGRFPALWVEIEDDSNVPGYRAAIVRSLSNNYIRWHQEAICHQRGQFHMGPWRLISGDPFGIFSVTLHYPISDEIVIHPPIHTQLPLTLPAGQSSGQVRARRRAWHALINAATIRQYQPADPYRWIHWPKTAQTDELMVRQFDLDAAGDIWLLLDASAASQLGSGVDGTEEQSVILAASIIAQALSQNRAVGLASYGQRPSVIPPARGEGQQWRLLRALALLRATGDTSLRAALRDMSRLARRGTALVIITATADAGWIPLLLPLQQRGVQSSIILLDQTSYGGFADSRALRQAIHQLGINCHLVTKDAIGVPLQPSERHGFWEFKVTQTGRVFTVRTPYE